MTVIESVIFGLCFPSRSVAGPNLPESIINEAEAAWRKVVATVNSVHPDSLESQFYPLFAERVTEPLMIEGKNVLTTELPFSNSFLLSSHRDYSLSNVLDYFVSFCIKSHLHQSNCCFRLLFTVLTFLSFQFFTSNCEMEGGHSLALD